MIGVVAMILRAALLLTAARCGFVSASHVDSTNAPRYSNRFTSTGSTRARRQTFAFDEFGLPRYSSSQGSSIFEIARRAVGIPGSFLGSTRSFGNESPFLEHDELPTTTEEPRYGPNHPPGPYTVAPRYSTTPSDSDVNSSVNEKNQTPSNFVLPSDLLIITDQVTDPPPTDPPPATTSKPSPIPIDRSTILPSGTSATVDGRHLTTDFEIDAPIIGVTGASEFIMTKPVIPFPLTIDPGTAAPTNATEQPASLTSSTYTAAQSTSSTNCYCPCLATATYAPAQPSYFPAPPPSPTAYIPATAIPSYFPPPPALRPSYTDTLTPLRSEPPAFIFGPAPPRVSGDPFPLPPDVQVGHPEPPFQGDSNSVEDPLSLSQDQFRGLISPPRQFGVSLAELGHPEPPPPPARHYASKLKSNGVWSILIHVPVFTSCLPMFLTLCQLNQYR